MTPEDLQYGLVVLERFTLSIERKVAEIQEDLHYVNEWRRAIAQGTVSLDQIRPYTQGAVSLDQIRPYTRRKQ